MDQQSEQYLNLWTILMDEFKWCPYETPKIAIVVKHRILLFWVIIETCIYNKSNLIQKLLRKFVTSKKRRLFLRLITPTRKDFLVSNWHVCSKFIIHTNYFNNRDLIYDSLHERSMSCQKVDSSVSEAHCGYTSFHEYVITIKVSRKYRSP